MAPDIVPSPSLTGGASVGSGEAMGTHEHHPKQPAVDRNQSRPPRSLFEPGGAVGTAAPRVCGTPRPEEILALQRSVGNQAVRRLLTNADRAQATPMGIVVQRDLKPGDAAPALPTLAYDRMSNKIAKEQAIPGDPLSGLEPNAWGLAAGDLAVLMGNPQPMSVLPATQDALVKTAIMDVLGSAPASWAKMVKALTRRISQAYLLHPTLDVHLGVDEEDSKTAAKNFVAPVIQTRRREQYQTIVDEDLRQAALSSDLSKPLDITVAATMRYTAKPMANLPSPDKNTKSQWSTALRGMPTVADAIAGTLFAKNIPAAGGLAWTFPTNPADVLFWDDQTDAAGGPVPLHYPIRARLDVAWTRIRHLVDASVLKKTRAPKVRVRDSDEFRGHYSPSTEEIHISRAASVTTIVHEFGHHLENTLESDLWFGVQRLLHGRHEEARRGMGFLPMGADTLIAIGSHPFASMQDEPRFKAEMPATGKYSAKAYESGDTEVVSMSLQFLADPAAVKSLIDDDPQQASLLLRTIKPGEYATHVGTTYDGYLG